MKPEISAYVDSAPEAQRAALTSLHDKIVREMPEVEPIMPNGFPVWTVDGKWCCGFATRKKGPMLYVMASGVLDRHEDVLGKLRTGRSCVEYKASRTMSLEELDALADVLYREARESMGG